MTTAQDVSIGIAVEITYKTYVAPTKHYEPTDIGLDWDKNIKQGQGLRVGSRVARSARRVVPSAQGGGDFTIEAISKSMGQLWNACLGSSTSTLVSGSTFQQVHTLGDTPPSLSVQEGLPQWGGTVDTYSWLGCMVDSFEFAFPNTDIASLKVSLDAGDISTAQSYVAPTYPSAPNLFHFGNFSLFTGALTAPTATTLASAVGTTANVRGGSITVKNNIRKDRFNGGGGGRKSKPVPGLREISGSLTIEYDQSTYRDLVLNDGALTVLAQFTAGALSTGVETLQVVIPEVKLKGQLPKPNGTDPIIQTVQFDGLDNLTAAQPIWVVQRTSDATL